MDSEGLFRTNFTIIHYEKLSKILYTNFDFEQKNKGSRGTYNGYYVFSSVLDSNFPSYPESFKLLRDKLSSKSCQVSKP